MNATQKVVGIVGSYRKNGIIDSAVTEILEAAAKKGAQTETIYLQDRHIEFCTNCRTCMQQPGVERGKCILADDMDDILNAIESADSLVIGAPVNFGNVNALTRQFLERCVCYGYWPWKALSGKLRNPKRNKKAILVSSSGAPALMARFLTETLGSLKTLAKMLGAKPVGVLWIGLVNRKDQQLSDKIRRRAKQLSQKLVA